MPRSSFLAVTSVTIGVSPYCIFSFQEPSTHRNAPSAQTPNRKTWPAAWFSFPTCGKYRSVIRYSRSNKTSSLPFESGRSRGMLGDQDWAGDSRECVSTYAATEWQRLTSASTICQDYRCQDYRQDTAPVRAGSA